MKFSIETSKRTISVTPKAGRTVSEVFITPTIGYTREKYKTGLTTADVIFGFAAWHVTLMFAIQSKED